MTLFSITAMPGSKIYNGMICGFAECIAALSSGVVLKFASDRVAYGIFVFVCISGNILYQYAGAGDGGLLAKFILFYAICGIGGSVNTNYLLLELRVPPEKLGASMVILLTICMFISAIAP